jgi:hypothetical protein
MNIIKVDNAIKYGIISNLMGLDIKDIKWFIVT